MFSNQLVAGVMLVLGLVACSIEQSDAMQGDKPSNEQAEFHGQFAENLMPEANPFDQ